MDASRAGEPEDMRIERPVGAGTMSVVALISTILGGVAGIGTQHLSIPDMERRIDVLESKTVKHEYHLEVTDRRLDRLERVQPAKHLVKRGRIERGLDE